MRAQGAESRRKPALPGGKTRKSKQRDRNPGGKMWVTVHTQQLLCKIPNSSQEGFSPISLFQLSNNYLVRNKLEKFSVLYILLDLAFSPLCIHDGIIKKNTIRSAELQHNVLENQTYLKQGEFSSQKTLADKVGESGRITLPLYEEETTMLSLPL